MKRLSGIAALSLAFSVAGILFAWTGIADANGPAPSAAIIINENGQPAGTLNELVAAGEIGMIVAQSGPAESGATPPVQSEPAAGDGPADPPESPAEPPVPSKPSKPCVNINTADETQLTVLKGIGPASAANIAAYRKQHGPFKKKEDLQKVKGIGPAKFAQVVEFICL